MTPSSSADPAHVLYVAYPLAPVTDESCGGAEQMLRIVERQMFARGMRTAIAACEGSRAAGKLIVTGAPADEYEQLEEIDHRHHACVIRAARNNGFELLHDHGGRFWNWAGQVETPVLVTLHLPRDYYPETAFAEVPPNVSFVCVSRSQHREFADIPEVLGWIPNGVEVERFPFSPDAGEYLIWVGRICEEKAPHIAIDVAARAGLPLVIVGPEQLYSCHQRYADQHLKGRMNSSRVHFAGNPDFTRKAELLQQARALLVTSQAEETSSLVAMEAMACGTPVIALNRGALAEVVAHSETGFVVDTEDEMVEKIACIGEISREACRAHTVRKHSASKMGARYAELYARVVEAPVADARDYARPVLNAAAFD